MVLRLAFAISLAVALLLLTLQFFLTPVFLEMEYEYAGFPAPPRPLTSDQRYIAAQAFLSYLNVEIGGATLRTLSELKFDGTPFFNESDLSCVFRAKELRASFFGYTFIAGVLTIALGLFMAVGDFERARRTVIVSALGAILLYTGLSVVVRVGFANLTPPLLSVVASATCDPARVSGLPQIFPPMIFADALISWMLIARYAAAAVALFAWLFGFVVRVLAK